MKFNDVLRDVPFYGNHFSLALAAPDAGGVEVFLHQTSDWSAVLLSQKVSTLKITNALQLVHSMLCGYSKKQYNCLTMSMRDVWDIRRDMLELALIGGTGISCYTLSN